ncbi:MAG: hypothetical protein N3A68_07065 [Bacteroidia bacterium]|jgi:hypothetical protein|nr:hypothetical protein [Bacteroidia bacterium]GIV23402.1 MAG: hypothetical protein KatS3mg025_1061 [Bacteroidia bacterium]
MKKSRTFAQKEVPMEPTLPKRDEAAFVPYGSLAFFGLLVLLTILIWLGSYFLMLKRG